MTVVPVFLHQLAEYRSPFSRETKNSSKDQRIFHTIRRLFCESLLQLHTNDVGRGSRIGTKLRDECVLREGTPRQGHDEPPLRAVHLCLHIITRDAGTDISDACLWVDEDGDPNSLPGTPGYNNDRDWNGYEKLLAHGNVQWNLDILPKIH